MSKPKKDSSSLRGSSLRQGASGPDAETLRGDPLDEAAFPGGASAPFRVYIEPSVHSMVAKHAAESPEVEICGVLAGSLARDAAGPFAWIKASIRGESAQNKFAEVTFTHETWSKINSEMDSKYSDLSIMGWYHTHPDFGIFLSDRDRFIQENFFSGPGQVAYVVDPVRKIEGVFVWRGGKPVLADEYWVGEQRRKAPAQRPDPHSDRGSGQRPAPGAETSEKAPAGASGGGWFSTGGLLLALFAMLLGYSIASFRSGWETWDRERIILGAIADTGIWKALRPDLDEEMEMLRTELRALALKLEQLHNTEASENAKPDKTREETWRVIAEVVTDANRKIDRMVNRYALTEAERDALRKTIHAALESTIKRNELERESAASGGKAQTQKSGPAEAKSERPSK